MSTPVTKKNLFRSWITAQTRSDKNAIAGDQSMIKTFQGYKKSNDQTYEAAIKAQPSRKDEFERDMRASDKFFGGQIKKEESKLKKDDAALSSLSKATPANMISNKDFQKWLGGQVKSTEGKIALEKQQIQTIQNDHLGGNVLQQIQKELSGDEARLQALEKFRR